MINPDGGTRLTISACDPDKLVLLLGDPESAMVEVTEVHPRSQPRKSFVSVFPGLGAVVCAPGDYQPSEVLSSENPVEILLPQEGHV